MRLTTFVMLVMSQFLLAPSLLGLSLESEFLGFQTNGSPKYQLTWQHHPLVHLEENSQNGWKRTSKLFQTEGAYEVVVGQTELQFRLARSNFIISGGDFFPLTSKKSNEISLIPMTPNTDIGDGEQGKEGDIGTMTFARGADDQYILFWDPGTQINYPIYKVEKKSMDGTWVEIQNSDAKFLFLNIPDSASVTLEFRITGCHTESDCPEQQIYTTKVSRPFIDLDPAIDPSDEAPTSAVYEGSLAGNFGIDPLGRANYSLPIQLPQGGAGPPPNLSITYNSSAIQSSSLGPYWSVNGLSSISRCKADRVRDGYFSGVNDGDLYKYCMDGRRLVPIAYEGEVFYKLEDSSQYKIVPTLNSNKPIEWTVYTPDGGVLSYGQTSDSKEGVRLHSISGDITEWHLTRSTNKHKIPTDYFYQHDQALGYHRIKRISYGYTELRPNYNISNLYDVFFNYKDEVKSRPNSEEEPGYDSRYRYSSKYSSPGYLDNISIEDSTGKLASYSFDYLMKSTNPYWDKRGSKQYRLNTITQCLVKSDGVESCLNPVSVEWTDVDQLKTRPIFSQGSRFESGYLIPQGELADINKDGKMDNLEITNDHLRTSLTGNLPNGSVNQYFKGINRFSDINRDGYPDVVSVDHTISGVVQIKSWLYNPTTGSYAYSSAFSLGALNINTITGINIEHDRHNFYVVDVNGDTLDDLLLLNDKGAWVAKNYGASFNAFSRWSPNGTVPVFYSNEKRYFTNPLNGEIIEQFVYSAYMKPILADFNGDSLPDILNPYNGQVALNNKGIGFKLEDWSNFVDHFPKQVARRTRQTAPAVAAADTNADGLTDLIMFYPALYGQKTKFAVLQSTGRGFVSATGSFLHTPGPCYPGDSTLIHCAVAELNGDGRADIIVSQRAPSAGQNYDAVIYWGDSEGSAYFKGESVSSAGMIAGSSWRNFKLADLTNNGFVDAFDVTNNHVRIEVEGIEESNIRKINLEHARLTDSSAYSITNSEGRASFGYNAMNARSYSAVSNDFANGNVNTGPSALDPRLQNYSVVKSVAINDFSNGQSYLKEYKYANAAYDRKYGWGFMGFGEVTSKEYLNASNTKYRKTSTSYHTKAIAFPNIAVKSKPIRKSVYYADPSDGAAEKLVSSVDYQWIAYEDFEDADSSVFGANYPSPSFVIYPHETIHRTYSYETSALLSTEVKSIDVINHTTCNKPAEGYISFYRLSQDYASSMFYPLMNKPKKNYVVNCDKFGYSYLTTSGTETAPLWKNLLTDGHWQLGLPGHKLANEKVYNSEIDELFSTNNLTKYEHTDIGLLKSVSIAQDDAFTQFKTTTYSNFDALGYPQTTDISWPSDISYGLSFNSISSSTSRSFTDNGDKKNTSTTHVNTMGGNKFAYNKSSERKGYFQSLSAESTGLYTSSYTLDHQGRRIGEINSGQPNKVIRYQVCNSCFSYNNNAAFYVDHKVQGRGLVREYYDTSDRLLGERWVGFDGQFVFQLYTYDYRGYQLGESNPFYAGDTIYWTTTYRDILGRVKQVVYPDTTEQNFAYYNETTTITDREGKQTAYQYDSKGRVRIIEDTTGNTISNAYGPKGSLVNSTVTTPQSDTYTFLTEYDLLGRKVLAYDPVAEASHIWSYNPLDLVAIYIDPRRVRLKYEYDQLGRKTAEIYNESKSNERKSEWLYHDNVLRSVKGEDSNKLPYTKEYKYVANTDLIESETLSYRNNSYITNYQYDDFYRLIITGYPSGEFFTKNNYNQFGYRDSISELSQNTTVWLNTQQDAYGNATEEILRNGVSTSRTYEPETGYLDTLTVSLAGLNIVNHDYGFSPLGNLTSRDDLVGGTYESFCYDDLHRLLADCARDDQYDSLGNLQFKTDATSLSYESSNAYRLKTSVSDGVTKQYSYDAAGNIRQRGAYDIQYSDFGKPTLIESQAGTLRFDYDPDEQLLYSRDDNEDALYIDRHYKQSTINGQTTEIFYVEDIAAYSITNDVGQWRYFHRDHIGSTVAKTSDTALDANALPLKYYDTWGNAVIDSWTGTTKDTNAESFRGFTNHRQFQAHGVIHMNGRVYDPLIGRFLSPDPIIQAPKNTQSYNRYAYVMNNPLSLTDPSGYCWTTCSAFGMDMGTASGGAGYTDVTRTNATWGFGRAAGGVDSNWVSAYGVSGFNLRNNSGIFGQTVSIGDGEITVTASRSYGGGGNNGVDHNWLTMHYNTSAMGLSVTRHSDLIKLNDSINSVVDQITQASIAVASGGLTLRGIVQAYRNGLLVIKGGLPKTRKALHSDLTDKGYNLKSTTNGNGYATYKGPGGKKIDVKPTGEVIHSQRVWKDPNNPNLGKGQVRLDYEGNRLPGGYGNQSHSTGHFVESFNGPIKSTR